MLNTTNFQKDIYTGDHYYIPLVNLFAFICCFKKILRNLCAREAYSKSLRQLFLRCSANKLLQRLFLVKNLHLSKNEYMHSQGDDQRANGFACIIQSMTVLYDVMVYT